MTINRTTHAVACALLLSGTLTCSLAAQQSGRAVYYSVPSWAPDGKTIAFESNRDGEAAVYTIRPDGTGLTRLTPRGTLGEQPNWSTDGRRIVFTSSRDGVRQLLLMKPDGGDVVVLPGTTNGFLAAFSPSGRWLLFAAQDKRPSNQYRVVVMHADGSNRRSLGDMTKSNEDPRWTIDGERVVFTEVPLLEILPNEAPRDFVRRRTQAQQLVSITPDGLDARVLSPEEANRITRDRGLSPDGKWMVHSKQVAGVTGLYLQEQPVGTERLLDRAQQRFGPRDVDALPSSAPTLVARYGDDALAFGELRIPSGTGPFPVAVVIHGGCWTVGFATLKNTAPLASALTEAGVATWNIEYRQVGDPGSGWPGTFLDIGAGIDHLRTLAATHPIDLTRVTLVGHSAGAHLALWGAARSVLPKESPVRGRDPLRVAAAVAIDGPADVTSFVGPDARICGKPVIAPLMGGTPAEQPARYRDGSPHEMLPLGVPQYLVAAAVLSSDDAVRYQARARSAGDSVSVLAVTNGNHFDVIGPGRDAFPAVLSFIRQAMGLQK